MRARRKRVNESDAADPQAVGRAAVALLARRDFASGELAGRLTEQGFAAEPVAEVLAELGERGYVDDARFAAQFVSYHAGRGHGPARIRRDLAERGLASAVIEDALTGGPDWHALARECRIRKFGPHVPKDWPEKARQSRFLQYRGFSNDHIRSALGADIEHPDS